MKGKLYIKTLLYSFALLGILFIPFTFDLFPYQFEVTTFLFGGGIRWFLAFFFQSTPVYQEISSDSSAMYVLLLLLLLVAASFAAIISSSKKWKNKATSFFYWSQLIICYYLALQWFNYGFDKLFKGQFYFPEPNILYTPLGYLDKDILFWSTMGTSYTYNVLMGGLELLAGSCLLFKKTRVLGLLLSFSILLNILAINFSFDISLKLYASFLCFITVIGFSPSIKSLYDFFIRKRSASLLVLEGPNGVDLHWLKPYLKTFIILLFILEGCYPYFQRQNFNDDLALRPYLHGAYAVIDDSLSTDLSIKRFFIHRSGYLIFQYENEEMQDFRVTVDTVNHQFHLIDYEERSSYLDYTFMAKDSILELENSEFRIKGKSLDWQQLLALKNQFNWTID